MHYIYHKAASGNFGDDLNPWLWPQIFNEPMPENEEKIFLGIGSILYNENQNLTKIKGAKKIVFGTGIRPSDSYKNLSIDDSWDIRFLRGPLSAMALKNQHAYITDAAYAIRSLTQTSKLINCEKKYEVSLMPYFKSVDHFDWKKICDILGYHYISPLSENGVEFTLQEIASSKKLITEAMHGAILADALRVPWHRYILSTFFYESQRVSEFKWMDWLFSMDLGYINASNIEFYKKNLLNKILSKLTASNFKSETLNTANVHHSILEKLSEPLDFYLSTDNKIIEIDEKILNQIKLIKK